METFFQSVARAFSGNRQALPGVVVALLVLLAAVVLLQLVAMARGRWDQRLRFRELLLARGLGPEEVRFAGELAARAGVEPLRLATHLDVFERATAQALAEGQAGAQAAPRIRRLRQALGFDRLPPHAPLLSTRELPPGIALTVVAEPAVIAEQDELGFAVELRDRPAAALGELLPLGLVHVREARYALACRLAAAERRPEGGWLLRLAHDERPVRQQQREWARVPLTGPIALRPAATGPGPARPPEPVTGRLIDLGGGGALAACPAPLPVGTLARVAFRVGETAFDDLTAVVLACEPEPEPAGRWRLHLEFTGRPGPERERLVAALTRLELERRRGPPDLM